MLPSQNTYEYLHELVWTGQTMENISHARYTQYHINGICFSKSHITDFSSGQKLEFYMS